MTEQDINDFKLFLSPETDRKSYIQSYLNKNGIDCPVIQLEDKNHLYVKFPLSQYNSMFKIKTVLVHYDVFEGSTGANDNSAAVFSILKWAVKLFNQSDFHNVRIIFTDGEEDGQEGVSQQGAYALAQVFKRIGILNDDIFVFDSVGRGTVPIICKTKLSKGVSKTFAGKIYDLEIKAEKIIKNASGGKWFKLDSAYSDNASFLANGIPAVALTMLPSGEVNNYLLKGVIPETWKMFHTEKDTFENLTLESFTVFSKILDNLAKLKTLG